MNSLVLASASAARAKLLANAGISLIRDPADIDEAAIKTVHRGQGRSAADCAEALAAAKAAAVAGRHAQEMVLGADQLLCCEGRWFDKPRDRAEALAQLDALNGRSHELLTAAAIWHQGKIVWRALERPRLTLRRCSAAFLEEYLTAMGPQVCTTVGAYELEGLGAQLMERVEGDYFAILGLPLLPLLAFLRRAGVLSE